MHSKEYDLTPINTPTLSGWQLSLYAWACQLPFVKDLLANEVKRLNKIQGMVDTTSRLSSESSNRNPLLPLYYPIHEMTQDEKQNHEEMVVNAPVSIRSLIAAQGMNKQQQQQNGEDRPFFQHWTVHDYVSRYLKKTVTPTQVVEHLIQIIEKVNEKNPIIIHMDPDKLRKEAADSTERYAKLTMKGDLDGVPILIKDEIPVKGFPMTCGTSFLNETVEDDPSPIANLKDEGVLIVGKTNQHEIGIGTTGCNVTYGTPKNPYNCDHFTGGSSSGSAAAVAMGLVPIALGMDGGGSIRIPSSLCGCIGVKPTFERLPIQCDEAPSLAHLGVFAGSVNDAAIAYAIMGRIRREPAQKQHLETEHQIEAQSDSCDGIKNCPDIHLHDYMTKTPEYLKGLRIGVFWDHLEDAEDNVVNATKKAIEFFRSQGSLIIDINLSNLRDLHIAHSVTILTEMALFMEDHLNKNAKELAGETICALAYGRSFTARDFLAAQKMRRFAMRQVEDLFQNKIDIILSPATPCIAPKIQEEILTYGGGELNSIQTTTLMRYVVHGNMTGIPGVVLPIGYDEDTSLPISLLIQASHWREDILFRVAKEAERLLSNGWNKPTSYVDVLGSCSTA